MASAAMRGAAEALARGEIDFGGFVRRTRQDWKQLAAWMHRRWVLPVAVEAADLEQHLLMQAWAAWCRWDAERGSDPTGYLVWCAVAKTTSWIHAQRGAGRHGNPTKRLSIVPVVFSSLDGPEGDRQFVDGLGEDPRVEATYAAAEALRVVAGACGVISRAVLDYVAQAEGDLSFAAERVYADPRLRVGAWLRNVASAERLVARSIREAREVVESVV